MIKQATTIRILIVFMAASLLLTNAGCVGGLAQLMYVIRGHKNPAQFDGLKEKKIAVVVLSDAGAYGADTLTYTLGKAVSIDLARNVKKASVVPPSEIESWIDQNGFDDASFVEIGRGVEAQMVVAVEVAAYTIHEGSTLYKGQSDLTISVYDIENGGQLVYSKGPEDFVFPKNGRPRIQTSDRKFEQLYLSKMTKHISQLFYSHDRLESIAEEAAMPVY